MNTDEVAALGKQHLRERIREVIGKEPEDGLVEWVAGIANAGVPVDDILRQLARQVSMQMNAFTLAIEDVTRIIDEFAEKARPAKPKRPFYDWQNPRNKAR